MIDRLPPLDGTSIWVGTNTIFSGKIHCFLWVVVLIVVIAAMIVLRKQKFVHVVMFISGCMTLMLLVTACSTVITRRGTAFQTASACQRGRRIRDVCGQQFRDPCVGYGRFQRVYLTVRGTSGVPGDLWSILLILRIPRELTPAH